MRIRNSILLSNKELKCINFDGTTDIYLHVCIFFYEVSLITLDEDLYANLFPLYLKGKATKWFSKLPHDSITSFAQLKSVFCDHYQIHIAKRVTFSDLMKKENVTILRSLSNFGLKRLIRFMQLMT